MPIWIDCFHMVLTYLCYASTCLIGARMSVPLVRTEFDVLRPASVSMEGSVIMWVARASVKQAFLVSAVRHACVLKGSTALNVTSGVPATWKTRIGEAWLPLQGNVHYLEREIGREIPTLRPLRPLGHPGQPLSKWKTFVLGGGGGWSKSEVLKLLDGCGWILNSALC
mgnify:CR=1 FL=1